jgi:hypothetical protein
VLFLLDLDSKAIKPRRMNKEMVLKGAIYNDGVGASV